MDCDLDFLHARDLYEAPFTMDDHPTNPKELLTDTIHKFTLQAEGIPEFQEPSVRQEYVVALGIPFLPGNGGDFPVWLSLSMTRIREAMGIKLDISILLYSEVWPCDWGATRRYRGPKVLSGAVRSPSSRRPSSSRPR